MTDDMAYLSVTDGLLSLTMFTGVQFGGMPKDRATGAAEEMKTALQDTVNASDTARVTGAACRDVLYGLPPTGPVEGVGMYAVILVDMKKWNQALGPGKTGKDAAQHLCGLLQDAPAPAGVVIDAVHVQLAVSG